MRPELRAALHRHGETIAAGLTAALGIWIAVLGGWFLLAVGLCLTMVALVWGATALRRTRFSRPVTDPGLVEVDERRIAYFGAGAALGGHVALDDLSEIRMLRLRSARYWRLKTGDGQAILIPTGASGAESLFDAFASLPGIDMRRLADALEREEVAQSLWSRPGPGHLDRDAR
ncbi:hypothetical protein [Paenirhodobacter sp.]|uniref:hypothetical protein n=1 Tax=Paenirhodobacter sp. TaxID=1965326 RepID=UPI003B41F5A4